MTTLHRPAPPRLASSPSSSRTSRMHSRNTSRQVQRDDIPPEPPSPLTYQLNLASDTVERLAARLADVQERTTSRTRASSIEASLSDVQGEVVGDGPPRCCCEARAAATGEVLEVGQCAARDAMVAMDKDLTLSATIGQALLQRYEALKAKHDAMGKDHEEQAAMLASTLTQCANLERANDTHLKRYGELSRKNEGLEKRIAQMHHTQQLTSTTLLSLRSELTTLRRTQRTEDAASDAQHDQLTEAYERDRALEETNADLQARVRLVEGALSEAERLKEEEKGRRILFEDQVRGLREKIQEKTTRESTEHLAQAAKQRVVDILNHIQDPSNSDAPEMQGALEALVADNVVAQHTAATLSAMLASASEETKTLHRENDELRAALGVAPRTPRLGEADHQDEDERDLRNTSLLARSSGGISTTSDALSAARRRPLSMHPSIGSRDRKYSWTPSLAASVASSGRNSILALKRESLTPSLHSAGPQSPRSTLAPAATLRDPRSSPAKEDDRRMAFSPTSEGQSPRPRLSVGYTLNGMPKRSNSIAGSSHGKRTFSSDRPNVQRAFSAGVDSIAESSAAEDDSIGMDPGQQGLASPLSPSAESRRDIMRRKRLTLNPSATYPSTTYPGGRSPQYPRVFEASPSMQHDGIDSPSSFVDGPASPAVGADRRTLRRPIILLSCSKSVQTDAEDDDATADGTKQRDIPAPADPGLAALGYQPAGSTAAPSSHVMSAFSPAQTQTSHTERSETSSLHDTRSAALPLIIEHLQKLLGKIRQSDVPTLTRRLRRQHLPGDVGHLSQSTMRALAAEVGELRTQFKFILDHEKELKPDSLKRLPDGLHESAVSRRDLALLLRLFKEVFASMVELQATVNSVIIDPATAAKLKAAADAAQDDDGLAKAAVKSGGGLGWIAAPLAKYFVTAQADIPSAASASGKRGVDHGKLRPPAARAVPKQSASTLATTTHVNVEFGGSGTVKRATSTMPTSQTDPLPPSPADTLTRGITAPAIIPQRAGPHITLGDGSSRGAPPRREELLGIFAGASSGPRQAGVQRLRTATSQNFGTARSVSSGHKRQISSAVDAVIDQPLPEHRDELDATTIAPSRRMRPRGLSDSSIRSTFVTQESVGLPLPANTERQQPVSLKRSDTQSRSVMHQLGRRFQALTGVGLVAAKPAVSDAQESAPAQKVADPVEAPSERPGPSPPAVTVTQPTMPRKGIAMSARSPTGSSPASRSGPGFLGMFAGNEGLNPAGKIEHSLADEYPDGIGGLSASYGVEPGSLMRRAFHDTT